MITMGFIGSGNPERAKDWLLYRFAAREQVAANPPVFPRERFAGANDGLRQRR
jgi:hypothetical protein